ncbi:hypothetical protein [Desulforegula conservatrix]|uniref:hypothetical protein n=1 Tax=Desulforegula conservatrix TaxID=153026 RepID=UPI0003FDCF66|nr:hypothetical protein [Desulforegula conservatrix]
MYLFSISESGENNPLVMTRIFRKMHNLRMSYTLESVKLLDPSTDAASLASVLSSKYNDRSFVIINPRFSQDGRPTVKVEMRPRLFINSAEKGAAVVDILRRSLVPVESVMAEEREGWEKDEGRGFGGDHRISLNDLMAFLSKMTADKRIFLSENFNMPEIKEVISKEIISGISIPENGEIRGCVLSAAIAVWIGEHQKQLKTHSAGGRTRI